MSFDISRRITHRTVCTSLMRIRHWSETDYLRYVFGHLLSVPGLVPIAQNWVSRNATVQISNSETGERRTSRKKNDAARSVLCNSARAVVQCISGNIYSCCAVTLRGFTLQISRATFKAVHLVRRNRTRVAHTPKLYVCHQKLKLIDTIFV